MFQKRRLGYVFAAVVLSSPSLSAQSSATFTIPESVLLFGTYNNVQVAAPARAQGIQPPVEVGYNHGYFAYPSIAPGGNFVAWGFAVEWQNDRTEHRARFALGFYSLTEHKWKTYGDFDRIGASAFSPDGSKIAFVAEQRGKGGLVILDATKGTLTDAPYPKGMPGGASLSWSPDGKRLAVEIQRGEQDSHVAVLDLDTGNVQTVGEGTDPAWSPTGEWIAYYDPSGQKCMLVHPDGTGQKLAKPAGTRIFSYKQFGYAAVWSPDGKKLLLNVIKGDGPNLDVMLLELDSGRTTRKSRNGLPVFGWVPQSK